MTYLTKVLLQKKLVNEHPNQSHVANQEMPLIYYVITGNIYLGTNSIRIFCDFEVFSHGLNFSGIHNNLSLLYDNDYTWYNIYITWFLDTQYKVWFHGKPQDSLSINSYDNLAQLKLQWCADVLTK